MTVKVITSLVSSLYLKGGYRASGIELGCTKRRETVPSSRQRWRSVVVVLKLTRIVKSVVTGQDTLAPEGRITPGALLNRSDKPKITVSSTPPHNHTASESNTSQAAFNTELGVLCPSSASCSRRTAPPRSRMFSLTRKRYRMPLLFPLGWRDGSAGTLDTFRKRAIEGERYFAAHVADPGYGGGVAFGTFLVAAARGHSRE